MLLERPFPGATTCVLVGALTGGEDVDFGAFASVLWIVDSGAADPQPACAIPKSLEVIFPDRVGAAVLSAALDRFMGRDPRHLPSIYVTEGAGALTAVLAEVYASVEGHHRAWQTRQKDGFLWQQHLLANLSSYANRRIPSGWAGALRGLPAFVCGAGPSLDAAAGAIAACADQAVILAADSALRALARHGVRADFAVSIDAAKVPEKCMPPDWPPDRVVLSSVSPPSWQRAVPEDRQFFISNRQVTLNWLAAQGLACTQVSATENCGSTGIELARFLGCSPIYLFGLDLALDPSVPGSRHNSAAEPTVYAASGFDPRQKLPQVPGNYGSNVATHVYGDLLALNRRLALWPQDLVFNVNDRGARLDNTTLVHPEALTVTSPAGAKSSLLAGLAPSEKAPDAVLSPAFGSLRRLGDSGSASIPALRQVLDLGGPQALCVRLRQLFADRDFARGLGAFSLKVMPHLVPPTEGSAEFWSALLDEMAELVRMASKVGTG